MRFKIVIRDEKDHIVWSDVITSRDLQDASGRLYDAVYRSRQSGVREEAHHIELSPFE